MQQQPGARYWVGGATDAYRIARCYRSLCRASSEQPSLMPFDAPVATNLVAIRPAVAGGRGHVRVWSVAALYQHLHCWTATMSAGVTDRARQASVCERAGCCGGC